MDQGPVLVRLVGDPPPIYVGGRYQWLHRDLGYSPELSPDALY